jgi:hypothetical protein
VSIPTQVEAVLVISLGTSKLRAQSRLTVEVMLTGVIGPTIRTMTSFGNEVFLSYHIPLFLKFIDFNL